MIGEEFDQIANVRQDIRTKIWPDVATGKQLDMCGEVADISRKVDKAIAVDFLGFRTTAIMASAWRGLDVMASRIYQHQNCETKNIGLLFLVKLQKTQRTAAVKALLIALSVCLIFPVLLL